MLTPIQGVDPRIAMKAAATQLSALKLFADANGDVIAHAGIKFVSVTRDVSLTGDQAITGAGFAPKGAIVLSIISDTNAAGIGITDGSSSNAIMSGKNIVAGQWVVTGSTYLISLYTDNGVNSYASLKSMDSDGMTLTWAKSGSPTGTATIIILFFR